MLRASLENRAERLASCAALRCLVAVSYTHLSSPRVDERILAAVGLPAVLGRDYLYAFNILAAEGIRAEVRYIDTVSYTHLDVYKRQPRQLL